MEILANKDFSSPMRRGSTVAIYGVQVVSAMNMTLGLAQPFCHCGGENAAPMLEEGRNHEHGYKRATSTARSHVLRQFSVCLAEPIA